MDTSQGQLKQQNNPTSLQGEKTNASRLATGGEKEKIMDFNQEKAYLLKNPQSPITGWVERIYNFGNKTVTHGRKYRVLNYFRYLNTYGEKGCKYPQWDEFIIIKNDAGYSVKMNLRGFKPCDAPVTKIQDLENRILKLEANEQKISI